MMRKTAWLGLSVLLLAFSGCLINDSKPNEDFLSVVQIRPDHSLQAAPEGRCYQLWFLDINDFDNPTIQEFVPLIRFQWDPVNFRTLDETGTHDTPLYTQTGKGMDTGENFLDHVIVILSIEPLGVPPSSFPRGPIIGLFVDPGGIPGVEAPSQLLVNREGEMRMDFFGGGIMQGSGGASVTLVSQSWQNRRQREGENVCWRDETEGMGIWFVQTQIRDLVVEDTAGVSLNPADTVGRGTLFTRDVDENADGRPYNIWIFPDHPESSFSNFDDVFPNQIPEVVFRDGIAERTAGILPPNSGGINGLGSNPMTNELGDTIGFMYFPDTTIFPYPDTCFLRVDNPQLTYCTNDSIDYRVDPFVDTNLIIRVFTTTWADTLITPSLLGLPAHQLGFGLEYEAWLIFDSVNNPDPRFKPLSLGRMSPFDTIGGALFMGSNTPDGICDGAQFLDSGNPYTDALNFDRNFTFPGEDFIENLPNGLAGPLDIFNIPEVERLKIWITMEPMHLPQFGVEDWALDEPFAQLVTYVGELLPELEMDTLECDRTQPFAPQTLNYPLRYRPITRNRTDLAEGNNWPKVKFFISSPDVD